MTGTISISTSNTGADEDFEEDALHPTEEFEFGQKKVNFNWTDFFVLIEDCEIVELEIRTGGSSSASSITNREF